MHTCAHVHVHVHVHVLRVRMHTRTHMYIQVMYTALNWMDKNRGTLHPDLYMVCSNSDSNLVSAIFPILGEAGKKVRAHACAPSVASFPTPPRPTLRLSALR